MKDAFQRTLLIVLSAGLCVLCIFQWRVQAIQRAKLEDLSRVIETNAMALHEATNAIRHADDQVADLQATITKLSAELANKGGVLVSRATELERLQKLATGQGQRIEALSKEAAMLQSKLKEACAGIEKQNAAFKDLVTQRNELAARLDASIKDRNQIVEKYNELVKQIEKLQAAVTTSPSNTGVTTP